MKNMVLHISTNKVGSECEVDLGYTEEEWVEMSDKEQHDAINEARWNVMDEWVEAV